MNFGNRINVRFTLLYGEGKNKFYLRYNYRAFYTVNKNKIYEFWWWETLFSSIKIIEKYKFHALSSDDIRSMSVMQIKTAKDLKSNNLGATKYDECTTCH